MPSRRSFIQKLGAVVGGTAFGTVSTVLSPQMLKAAERVATWKPQEVASDEAFWYEVRQAFTTSPNLINLNNGGVSPSPRVVQEAVESYNRLSNEAPTYYMWRVLDANREALRMNLARLAGCLPEELAINRNSSESLETIIFGLPLQRGDEVVLTKQDYPNMIQAWKQRVLRDGIVLKWVDLDLPTEDDKYVLEKFEEQFTEKTKLVQITHMINWTGQILPARKIANMAHKRGIEVLVDAAHSFAQINFKIPDLDADYLGTSLHKWLCAPFGSGLLYVRKPLIKKIWPLFGAVEPEGEDIKKFEHLGTRSIAIEQAIGHAINFHDFIGAERKEARLRFLKNYWAEKVAQMPRVKLLTSLKPQYSCALAMFAIEGKEPSEVDQFLFNKYKIHTVAITWENIKGVRVTPHLYTSLADLDRLVTGIEALTKS
ncbi:MAG: aminotransferase class V-fold PLP-dependent enzyme [Cytophagales bacterium]|nr:MAG: aminotransferase class V-fold PLP-dependent enzyme [Cytophagales bacterium]TAF61974.1 MAG: aminotransferase class V-fold PLP-dependent enzyme [Cytophagales bacterium]